MSPLVCRSVIFSVFAAMMSRKSGQVANERSASNPSLMTEADSAELALNSGATVSAGHSANYFFYDAGCMKGLTQKNAVPPSAQGISDCMNGTNAYVGKGPHLILRDLYFADGKPNTVVMNTVVSQLKAMRTGGIDGIAIPIWYLDRTKDKVDYEGLWFDIQGVTDSQRQAITWILDQASSLGFRTVVFRTFLQGTIDPKNWPAWDPKIFALISTAITQLTTQVKATVAALQVRPPSAGGVTPLRIIYDLGGEIGGGAKQGIPYCANIYHFAVETLGVSMQTPKSGAWSTSTVGCSLICSDAACGASWAAQEKAYQQAIPGYGGATHPAAITTYATNKGATTNALKSLRSAFLSLHRVNSRVFIIETMFSNPEQRSEIVTSGAQLYYGLYEWPVSQTAFSQGNWVVDMDFVTTAGVYRNLPVATP